MCGIFGYIGTKNDSPHLVVEGLKKLEYRGYDSWGLSWVDNGVIKVKKAVGKISEVSDADFLDVSANVAIGHSRWATHGGVTEINAHPHVSHLGNISVVHNGIIENYAELKLELGMEKFVSETDTEVIPHLIEKYIDQGFEEAFKIAIKQLEGRFSIVAIDSNSQVILGARRGSPLILGVGKGEYFLASDIPAFLQHTNIVNYIDDGEMVVVSKDKPRFYNLDHDIGVGKRDVIIDWDEETAQKGEFEHFMLKEIMDQKETIQRAINQNEAEIMQIAQAIKDCRGCFFAGCGTAGKVCMAAEYFFSIIAERHVNFAPASEFPVYHHFLRPESLLIVVSQSGETADVLEAMDVAKKKGAKVLSIVNVKGSSVARKSDFSLCINAGPEKAVASTKAATSQLALLMLIAYAIDGRLEEGKQLLIESASKINDMLNPRFLTYIRRVTERLKSAENCYIIGKAANYPMALEAAIKIQEVSYVHAEGFAGGELKHGPIALITQGTPCIALFANDEVKKDILNNTIELKARGAYIIGIGPERFDVFDEWIKVPDCSHVQPIANLIPVQLMAYYMATQRGCNPDMPRNLAKSVTVK
jgi:glucosamine--fructose-6-phosphate aminotransferase (isomerizing)